MQSRVAAAYRADPAEYWLWRYKQKNERMYVWMDGWMQTNTVHGLPVQSRVAAAYRAVPAAHAMILAHMVMNGGKCNKGSRHGVKAKAGRQGMARQGKAVVENGPVAKLTGTGLVAKTAGR